MAWKDYETTEKEITSIKSSDKNCIGCERHGKDIMISYTSKQDGEDIIDLFLTREQAIIFCTDLFRNLSNNEIV